MPAHPRGPGPIPTGPAGGGRPGYGPAPQGSRAGVPQQRTGPYPTGRPDAAYRPDPGYRLDPGRREHTDRRPALRHPPIAPRKRRRTGRIVVIVLAVLLTPLAFLFACSKLVGAAADKVDEARAGGTVNVGEMFSYQSGLALTASVPVQHDAKNQFIVAKDEVAFETTVKITNGTKDPAGTALITINVTADGKPAERIFDDGAQLVTQDIAPGRSLEFPVRFKVKKGTKGPLQIAITDTFNEPVFFNGQLA